MIRALLPLAFAASVAAAQKVPPELATLANKAKLGGPVSAWCHAEFQSGHPGAFAVAVTASSGGRYLALDADGTATELGLFRRSAELSCYGRREAEKLDGSIRQSATVHGHITPRWDTTVVCGFLEDTIAECWQYSPKERMFIKVGQWIT